MLRKKGRDVEVNISLQMSKSWRILLQRFGKEPLMKDFGSFLRRLWALPIVGLLSAGWAHAGQEHVVSQKNKAFSVKKLSVKVGDSVKFLNEDSFAHNIFSLSPAKSFDLGSFGNGGSKSVMFDKPGKVEVECAVHPDMRLDIEVTP
jgi:plastocyanin